MMICWEDRCTSVRNITVCRGCGNPFCDDHMDNLTDLCLHCVPVDEVDYQAKLLPKYRASYLESRKSHAEAKKG